MGNVKKQGSVGSNGLEAKGRAGVLAMGAKMFTLALVLAFTSQIAQAATIPTMTDEGQAFSVSAMLGAGAVGQGIEVFQESTGGYRMFLLYKSGGNKIASFTASDLAGAWTLDSTVNSGVGGFNIFAAERVDDNNYKMYFGTAASAGISSFNYSLVTHSFTSLGANALPGGASVNMLRDLHTSTSGDQFFMATYDGGFSHAQALQVTGGNFPGGTISTLVDSGAGTWDNAQNFGAVVGDANVAGEKYIFYTASGTGTTGYAIGLAGATDDTLASVTRLTTITDLLDSTDLGLANSASIHPYDAITDGSTGYLFIGTIASGAFTFDSVHVASYTIPEPATLGLLGVGGGLIGFGRKKR